MAGQLADDDLGSRLLSMAISSESYDDCQQIAALLVGEGIDAWPVKANLAAHSEVEGLAAAVRAQFGGLDALVCNAGVAPHMGPLATADRKSTRLNSSH